LVSGPQLENFAKNIDFLGRKMTKKTEEIHPKYRKIADFRFDFAEIYFWATPVLMTIRKHLKGIFPVTLP
jgi:hypothetical protein